MPEERAYWSPGNQIYLVDGWSYGIDHKGRTVCIGTEPDIQKALTTPTGETFIDNIVVDDRNNRATIRTGAMLRTHRIRF